MGQQSKRRTRADTDVSSTEAFSLFGDTSEYEKRSVAKNIIDTHVRRNVENNTFNYSIQPGLSNTPEPADLVDDFIQSIDVVELFPEENNFGTVRINVVSSTIDTAKLSEVPGEPPTDTAPKFENTAWVKCSLKACCRFSLNGVNCNVAISITQHPIDIPDEAQP